MLLAGPRHCLRPRRRRRALARPRRALRAGPDLGPASAAAAAVRPSLGAHGGRVGAQRRLDRTGASAAGRRRRRARRIGRLAARHGPGRGLAARAVSRRLDGRDGPPALAAHGACDARAPDRARLSAARTGRRRAVRRVGRDPACLALGRRRHGAHARMCRRRAGIPRAPGKSRDGVALFWINNTFKTTRSFEDTYVERAHHRASSGGHRRHPPGRRAHPSPDLPVDDDRRRAGAAPHSRSC